MNETLLTQLRILKMTDSKPNFSELARIYDLDRRTIKTYYDGYDGKPTNRNKPSKLDKYETIIREKLQIKGTTNHNRISEIKLAKKNVIKKLGIAMNPIKKLDESILNPNTLSELEIYGTLIEEIDVSKFVNLKKLETYQKDTYGTKVIKGDKQEFKHIIDDVDYYEYASNFFF